MSEMSVFKEPNEREKAMQEKTPPEIAMRTLKMSANNRQVAGTHYSPTPGEQHWDRVARLKLDYYQAQITKYIERCWLKNGLVDVKKAQHFIEKYIELIESGAIVRDKPPAPLPTPKGVPHYEIQNHFETEGFVLEGDWWRCRQCRERFLAAIGENPSLVHRCVPEEPTGGGYVGQGED